LFIGKLDVGNVNPVLVMQLDSAVATSFISASCSAASIVFDALAAFCCHSVVPLYEPLLLV
jgi:hypothetical protein